MVSVTVAAYSVEIVWTTWMVKFKDFNHIPMILCMSNKVGM